MKDYEVRTLVRWLQAQMKDAINEMAAAQGDNNVAKRNRYLGQMNTLVAVMEQLPEGVWEKYAKPEDEESEDNDEG